jgi:hypothetical protein
MKQREFVYITREAYSEATKRAEKYNLSSEEKREDAEDMVQEAIAQNVKELVECTNSTGYRRQVIDGILQGLTGSHRTLQSDFMLALVNALDEYGNIPTDGRNEYVVKMAKRMAVVAQRPELEPSDIEDMLARR